jgi:hypothetical protein
MDFDKKDRIILINQFKILERLDPDGDTDYSEMIEILSNGYSIFYGDINRIVEEEEVSTNDCRFVLDVLDLYRVIERFKESDEDTTDIEEHSLGTFRGFDGNNESEYLSFTRFLIQTQGKFQEQLPYEEDNFNSHNLTIHNYRPMIEKWRSLEQPRELSKENIIEILEAGIPEQE